MQPVIINTEVVGDLMHNCDENLLNHFLHRFAHA